VGDVVGLTVGPDEVHLFDRESGRTLDPSAVAA
jgi:hypothetical protein